MPTLQQKWLIQSVNGWVDQLFYWHQRSASVQGYLEIRSRSNVWKEHTHTEGHLYDYTHFLLQIWGLFFSYILGKWLQKEDIAETAVHFVLKFQDVGDRRFWGHRFCIYALETGAWKMDFYIFSVINPTIMASCRGS